MATSIIKTWRTAAVRITVLLSAGLFTAGAPAQEFPPGAPISDEDREQMMERIRERMEEMQQQGGAQFPGMENMQQGAPFPGMENMQQQRGTRQFPGMEEMQQQRGTRQFPGFPGTTTPAQPSAAATQMTLEDAGGETLRLNFKDVDLSTFIKEISELLGMTPIIIDSNVQGTVTLYSSTPMAKSDVVPLFHLILKQKNAAIIEQDGVYQVIPTSAGLKTGTDLIEHNPPQAAQAGTPAAEPPAEPRMLPPGEPAGAGQEAPAAPAPADPPAQSRRFQRAAPAAQAASAQLPKLSTHAIRVEFVPARDLVEPIRLLMTEGGVIMPYDRLNMLILTDYDDSIDRILKIIRLLDSRYMDENLVELVKVDHNNSADVVTDLQKLFGSGAEGAASGVSFVSLDRMNSIFIMANSQRGLASVKKWIGTLDTITGRNIQTHVYIVQNSTAANIAMLISALYGEGDTQGTTGTGQTTGLQGRTQTGGISQAGGLTTGQQRGSFGTFSSSTGGLTSGTGTTGTTGTTGGFATTRSSLNNGGQLGAQFTTSQGITSMVIQGGEFSGLQGTVRLVVDDISNRLIIQSTPADYAFILETIEKMDVMPRQVIIEAQVFEVDLTDDLNFGVGAVLRERTGGSTTVVGLNAAEEDGSITGALGGYNIALVGNRHELLSALNALREKTNVKILEAPSVLAMDGTEAHITVGGEVPYAGSIYYQENDTAQSINYRDTGVTLYVRPRISASGSVTMEVLQEVSGVGTVSSDLGPTFTKSQVETTLTVRDRETVAIAGLIRDNHSLTRTGWPIISDIPIIGSLFGQTRRANTRSELIILITPRVIDNPDKHKEFTTEFKDSLRNVRKFSEEKEEERLEYMREAIEDREKKVLEQIEAEAKERERQERALRRKRN